MDPADQRRAVPLDPQARRSHELRTPLTVVLAAADLLEESPNLGVEERELVSALRSAAIALCERTLYDPERDPEHDPEHDPAPE